MTPIPGGRKWKVKRTSESCVYQPWNTNVGILLMVSSKIPVIQFQIIPCDTSRKSVILKPYLLPQVGCIMWYTDTTTTRQERRTEEKYQEFSVATSSLWSPLSNQHVYEDRTMNRMKANHFTQEVLYCQHYMEDSELQTPYDTYCMADTALQTVYSI